jgi:hypothetical protein
MVAGSLNAGDGLGEQRPGLRRVNEGVGQQAIREAHAEQDIITQLPGALDSVPSGAKSSLQLAGRVANLAEDGERFDEQPAGLELAGERDRLVPEPQPQRYVDAASSAGGGDQGCAEQLRVRPGVGPVQRRPEQAEGFLVPVPRHPVAPQRDAQAQDLRGPLRVAGRVPGGAPQVRLLGVQPPEPAALAGPGQLPGRRLGDSQVLRAVRRPGGGSLIVAGLGEPLGGELADGLQQPVAQPFPGRLGHHQALVHHRTKRAGDIERLNVTKAADRFGGVQIEAPGEHRQAAQQQLLGTVPKQ